MKPRDKTPITPELLLRAYKLGVFPMSEARNDPEIFWVDPTERGIFPLDGFHISRTLARAIRRPDYQIAIDSRFAEVVAACADRQETWINPEIEGLYRMLHHMGYAHSLEVLDGDALIGGVYGVAIGGAFFGESMFSHRRDASKIALAYLLDRLRVGGFRLFDTQFLTDHLASLGAIAIPRDAYRRQLDRALAVPANFFAQPSVFSSEAAAGMLQRMTQTS